MFDTLSTAQLEAILNQFSMPMFVIERKDPRAEFRVVGLNTPMEQLAGLMREDILGQSVIEMTTASNSTMEHCTTPRQKISCSNEPPKLYWHKTLQYSRSPEGYDRVVATAMIVPDHLPDLQDQIAFEDLHYFASIADLQLENLNSAFGSAALDWQVRPIDEERVMRLHATCRSIQTTVSEIKQIVQRTLLRHAPADMKPSYKGLEQTEHPFKIDTLDALASFSEDHKSHQTG